MRLLNRFWNWLCSFLSVVLRSLRQVARRESSFEDEQAAEPEQVKDATVTNESVGRAVGPKKNATITAASEVPRDAGKQVAGESSPVKPPKPGEPQVASSVKPQANVEVMVERRVVSSAERRKVIAPAAQVPTADQLVAGQLSAVHQPAASPTASAEINPESGKGRALDRRRANGRYSPGEATDQTAQRLARLLISEIKLYNKTESEGSGNNVYDALKEPIDKARKYYGQRLGTTVVDSMPDYFHAELVRALCAGDPSRLGPNYSTPRQN